MSSEGQSRRDLDAINDQLAAWGGSAAGPVAPMPEFRTARPNHPIVRALEADDIGSAFLAHMRELLVPGPWEVPVDSGFTWFPYRLNHTVEILDHSESSWRRLVCRSTFVLGEGFDPESDGFHLANYLNQRPIGAGVYCAGDPGIIFAASSVVLDAREWWNAFLFAQSVVRQVGIWENLMPRAWVEFNGRPPSAVHPRLGARSVPDQFIHEHLRPVIEPEAATGVWFSEPELRTFRAKNVDFARANGFDDEAVRMAAGELDSDCTSASNLTEYLSFELGGHQVRLRIGQSDHPDLGRGLEVLGCSDVRVFGGVTDAGQPPSAGFAAMFAVSMLNAYQAEVCPASLNLGGWTSWRGQLMRTRFIDGETVRSLLTINPRIEPGSAGVILSLLLTDETMSWQAFNWSMHESFLAESPELWERTNDVEWAGVEQNAGLMPLLVPNGVVSRAGLDRAPTNQRFANPVALTGADAYYQHAKVLAQWGIFNPSGPSVGSLEVAIDYEGQRALLIERRRHPRQSMTVVHAVLDQEGFNNLGWFAGEVIAELPWSPLDWFEIIDGECTDALADGLRRFIRRSGEDVGQLWRRLAADIDNPWARLERRGPVDRFSADDDVEAWLYAVTDPRNVDAHAAFLRSAWEGATAPGGPEAQDRIATALINEVHERAGRL
jgi:hypothetical protein